MNTKLVLALCAVIALSTAAMSWSQSANASAAGKPDPRIDKILEQNEQILKNQADILKNQAQMMKELEQLQITTMQIRRRP